jgi:large subunit ribosomal protein L30
MAKVKVTQKRSAINMPKDQKRTLEALGLRKINHSKEFELNPAVEGMINKVKHLVAIEEL